MRFTRRPRCEYAVTDRKRAAAVRLQRRQREKLPLLAPLIAEAQPGIDEVMATRVAHWVEWEQRDRDRRAAKWREARAALDRHEPATRRALLDYWNGHRWLPGDSMYLLDLLHGFGRGRLIIEDGRVRPAQLPAAMNSLLLGGHVRVGLEDNLYYRQGELATNLQLTERVVRLVREIGFDPATPAEAREITGLPLKHAPVRPHFALG